MVIFFLVFTFGRNKILCKGRLDTAIDELRVIEVGELVFLGDSGILDAVGSGLLADIVLRLKILDEIFFIFFQIFVYFSS